MLYLKTATIPLRHVISIRRMLYFQSLVARADDELIKKVYEAQNTNPVKGDWIIQLKEVFQFINEEINEKEALEMSKYEYKSMIKKKVKKGSLRIQNQFNNPIPKSGRFVMKVQNSRLYE